MNTPTNSSSSPAPSSEFPLQHIRLELARDPDFPSGSAEHGYELIAPLDEAGHISAAGWKAKRDKCRVRRFWGHEAEFIGHILHKPGGVGGIWAFHYDIRGAAADSHDETGFRFDTHVFRPGEYVSIREHDGALRTFWVKAVADLE